MNAQDFCDNCGRTVGEDRLSWVDVSYEGSIGWVVAAQLCCADCGGGPDMGWQDLGRVVSVPFEQI